MTDSLRGLNSSATSWLPKLFFDFLAILSGSFCALFLASAIGLTGPDASLDQQFLAGGLFSAYVMAGLAAVGLYRRRQRPRVGETVSRILVAVAIGSTLFLLSVSALSDVRIPAITLVIGFATIAAILIVYRLCFLKLLDSNPIKQRVLILGAGHAANKIGMLRRRSDRRNFQVVGYVPCGGSGEHMAANSGLQPIVSLDSIRELMDIDEIVVALDDPRGTFPTEILLDSKSKGVKITDIVAFLERECEQIDFDVMTPEWLVFASGISGSRIFSWSKRVFDVLFGSLLLLLTFPFLILVCLAIKAEDGLFSNVIYRQTRVGRHESHFQLLKFRSMVEEAESQTGPKWSAREGDIRITSVGRMLRRFRLDELPQLINVILGDMSIVGPRPERPEFVANLKDKVPFYSLRHSVKPGLTGWAQLNFPYGASIEDAKAKHKFDLYYLRHAGIFFDLVVLAQTFEVVVWGRGVSMCGPMSEERLAYLKNRLDSDSAGTGRQSVQKDVA